MEEVTSINVEPKTHTEVEYHYNKKRFYMSRAEHEFYDILVSALGDKYYIFPQAHLETFLNTELRGKRWHPAFRHIDEKSVDYLLCDKNYIEPLLAIELDDKTHKLKRRVIRDAEVERILKEAGLPLVRFENHGNFNEEEIARRIYSAL